jgi:hypothetical protein
MTIVSAHISKSDESIELIADSKSMESGDSVTHFPDAGTQRPKGRRVKFNKIQIREYERTLGDNPCVSSGPALSLDWSYNDNTQMLTIEEFEAAKPIKKNKVELLVPRHLREKILSIDCGVSRVDIANSLREIQTIKQNRNHTILNWGNFKTEEKMENFKRSIGRVVGLRKSASREIEILWEKANHDSAIALKKSRSSDSQDLKKSHSADSIELKRSFSADNQDLRKSLSTGTEGLRKNYSIDSQDYDDGISYF